MSDSFVTRVEGPAPEMEVSRDIVRRGLIFTPLYLAVCGVIWGLNGVWSAGYAIAIVLLNFMLAALTISLTVRISLALMMGAVLFGYLGRLGLTLIVTHLGLLFWEMRHVAASLAFPGLKPESANIESVKPLDSI